MEKVERQKLYKALLSRDSRYDGKFYFGVKTTGIYCRPICPAKPKFENVLFFRSKSEAELAGFRPCLRCKPDLSPLSPQWRGTAAIMGRALSLIEQDLEENQLTKIADKLGMTDRHLRRLFQENIGASPVEVSISRRLHLARQLLSQTHLSVTDIAFASGFKSLRRFNDAFKKTYQQSPSIFRKAESKSSKENKNVLKLELNYIPPFDWEWLMNFFQRHETMGVEHVSENQYQRHFQTNHGYNFYRLSHLKKDKKILVEIHVQDIRDLRTTIDQIKAQLDLGHNPYHIEAPQFKTELKNVRIPGAFDPFEVAISIILGQVVSTEQGKKNIYKLVQKFGIPTPNSPHPQLTHLFPSAEVLSQADLSSLGFTTARCEAIKELSQMVASGEIVLSRNSDLDETRKKLLSIKGIGSWTTELILMRCLADTDAFPANDLILKRALEKDHIAVEKMAPWRSYLAIAIWKHQAHLLSKKKRKS